MKLLSKSTYVEPSINIFQISGESIIDKIRREKRVFKCPVQSLTNIDTNPCQQDNEAMFLVSLSNSSTSFLLDLLNNKYNLIESECVGNYQVIDQYFKIINSGIYYDLYLQDKSQMAHKPHKKITSKSPLQSSMVRQLRRLPLPGEGVATGYEINSPNPMSGSLKKFNSSNRKIGENLVTNI